MANMEVNWKSQEDRPVDSSKDLDLTAVMKGVVAIDRSHWGILKFTGADRLRYLHNQSTNDFQTRKTGEGCETVFVTSTARTIDLTTAYINADDVLVIVSPNRRLHLYQWLDRFIFPMDRVEISDVSDDYAIFDLFGAESASVLQKLGLEGSIGLPQHSHQVYNIDGMEVIVAVGSSLTPDGATFIVKAADAAQISSKLSDLGAVFLDRAAWQKLRILQGRPIADSELTDDYNPLEAALCHTISLNKGCYIGQETIARLNTYKGVKQQLWGIKLANVAPPDTNITIEGEKIGKLTSCTATDAGIFGLAYIKTKAGGAGLNVTVGETVGEVIEVPFLSREVDS